MNRHNIPTVTILQQQIALMDSEAYVLSIVEHLIAK